MEPFIKVSHRNGSVFIRIVKMGIHGREATMAKLKPSAAMMFGLAVTQAADAARESLLKLQAKVK